MEAVEAVLEQERKAGNAKDARHKLTVERLRQKLVELQVNMQDLISKCERAVKCNLLVVVTVTMVPSPAHIPPSSVDDQMLSVCADSAAAQKLLLRLLHQSGF